MVLGTLLGSLAQTVNLANPLIPCVSQAQGMSGQSGTACLEQFQIVDSACTESGRDDFATGQVCQDLRFYSVAFLFTAVIISLSFLGRSIGVSLASTTTTSKTAFMLVSDFFPGRVNLPD